VDGVNNFFRHDTTYNNNLYTQLYFLETGFLLYNTPNISPTPCFYDYVLFPETSAYYYQDTISLSSSPVQHFDLYGYEWEQTFFLFDNTTQEFKGTYSILGAPPQTGFDAIVQNWNTRQPPASVFTPPDGCYYIVPPSTPEPDPQAPSFPKAFTMVASDHVVYYNGPDQWRIDYEYGISLLTDNKVYTWSEDPLNSILPIPCEYSEPASGTPGEVPLSPFNRNLGTAKVNGINATIWGTTPENGGVVWVWYLDENNIPLYTPIGEVLVSSFQLGAPPQYLFAPPSTNCIKGSTRGVFKSLTSSKFINPFKFT